MAARRLGCRVTEKSGKVSETNSLVTLVFGIIGFTLAARFRQDLRDVQHRIEAQEQWGLADELAGGD